MTELNEKAEMDATEVDNDNEKELKLKDDSESLNAGPSASAADSPSSSASTNSPSKDTLFEPTVDMMVNDFDDERTLEEEEALAEKEHEDPNIELSDLQKESDMPIEELLALYSIPPPTTTTTSSKKRKRKAEKSSVKKQHKEEEQGDIEEGPETTDDKPQSPSKKDEDHEENVDVDKTKRPEEPDQDEEPEMEDDEDEDTTTKPEDIDDNDDDTTNFEEDDPSELKNLYADNFDKTGLTRPEEEDEEDLEYMPDDDDDVKKTIMVGSEFQAQIPEGLCHYDDALPYENEDKLLWDPSKVTEEDIENYLYKSQSIISTTTNSQTNGNGNSFLNYIPTSGKHLRDDEQALFLLLQCGYNSEEALRRRRINVVSPSETPLFSEEECRNFESGLRLHGKCFHTIQQKVRTRSVGELVQFYYLWKKSERHDVFANKSRLEKKKYNINPCVTDLMEKFLEEHENNGGGTRDLGHRDRSVSPNVHCLLSTDMKRQRHDSTNSNNNEDIKPVSSSKPKDGTEKTSDPSSSPVHNFSESQMDMEKIDDHE